MAHYKASIVWQRQGEPFTDNRYSRLHRWKFDGGVDVPASASPHVVPPPLSDPAAVDPEEAFVASISSCHMLWFLHIAAKKGHVVDRYEDEAEGTMEEDEGGRLAMTRVVLRPRVSYAGSTPSEETETAIHQEAHEKCFIANSVRTDIVVAAARAV